MAKKILDALCLAVLCTILALGLWPFHSPTNEVSWLRAGNGLSYARYGTAMSSGVFEAGPNGSEGAGSVEIWLQPGNIWDSGTLLSFSTSADLYRFSLRETQTDLRVQAAIADGAKGMRRSGFDVDRLFYRAGPSFITVTSGARGTAVYRDGILARRVARWRLGGNQLTGRLVLGDSPGQGDSWQGRFFGLAVYRVELSPEQVLRHYESWTQTGKPEIGKDEDNAALYLFDEHAGNVVHNRANSAVDLLIPKTYTVLDQIFLEPVWTEFGMTRSYWGAALKNIVGFMPFGFCFCARLAWSRYQKRAALVSVVLGALASLTIEVLQSRLPTRDSGTTDLITNTLGTWIGAALFGSMTVQALLAKVPGFKDAGVWNGDRRGSNR